MPRLVHDFFSSSRIERNQLSFSNTVSLHHGITRGNAFSWLWMHTKLWSYWSDVFPRIALRHKINGFLFPVCARAYASPPMPFRYGTNAKGQCGCTPHWTLRRRKRKAVEFRYTLRSRSGSSRAQWGQIVLEIRSGWSKKSMKTYVHNQFRFNGLKGLDLGQYYSSGRLVLGAGLS